MADSALFIGWGSTVRGREANAAKVFAEAVETWSKLQAEGAIESWSAYFLEAHGGDLNGFFLLHGDEDALARARASEEMQDVLMRAGLIVENLGVVGAVTGGRINAQMEAFLRNAAELA